DFHRRYGQIYLDADTRRRNPDFFVFANRLFAGFALARSKDKSLMIAAFSEDQPGDSGLARLEQGIAAYDRLAAQLDEGKMLQAYSQLKGNMARSNSVYQVMFVVDKPGQPNASLLKVDEALRRAINQQPSRPAAALRTEWSQQVAAARCKAGNPGP